MKKIILALVISLFSFRAHAFVISPHVGLDYVSSTPHGYDKSDSLNGATFSVGAKVLGIVSLEGYYQKFASTRASYGSRTKPAAYGVDAVFDTLNLGVVEVLTTVGYGKYTLDGGKLNKNLEEFEDKTYRAGFGAQINPTSHIGIRAMYRYIMPEKFEFSKSTQELSIGLRYYLF